MNYLFILTILVVGLSGLVAQVLLLRELLVNFYGNELTLGIILANWIILEALGVLAIGKIIDRIKNKVNPVRNTTQISSNTVVSNGVNVFIILQIIFSLTLPLSIYLSRTFKDIIGIPFGEAIGLHTILYASFFIMLPISFCHGALFSSLCKIYSLYNKESASSIGKVYTWETIGTIIGGVIITYLFIPHLNSFQIVFIISISNLIICLLFKDSSKIFRYVTLFLIFMLGFFSLNGGINYIHRFSVNRQWKAQEVLDYRNSIYGNITVTKKEEQFTFFYNGIPLITTPYPDVIFVQEFGNLPLLFSKNAKDILVISGGAGGLISEILKFPVRKVDYAELDPLIIKLLKKYSSDLTRKELTDPRIKILNLDGRFFIKNTSNKYDIVLIGISKPQDLSTNRLFTQEFFSLAHKRLNPDGIIAFCLPGSLAYLSQELRDLNACILNGLKHTYVYVRIIPGDFNMFLASDSKDILEVEPNLIVQRMNQRNIKTDILIPSYIEYRLHRRWVDWFLQSLKGATRKINQDLRPFAVYEMLILWNKQFYPRITHIFEAIGNLDLKGITMIIFLITFVLLYIFYRKHKSAGFGIIYSIATTGFFGMLMNLALIFSFQVFYGYLYHRIGILVSIFMAGIALGSIIIIRFLEKIKNNIGLFIKLEVVVVVFSLILPWIINWFGNYVGYSYWFFITLFFIPGFLMGLEFPLASKIYLGRKKQVGNTAGTLYGADLIGGWIAGILGGIVLIPVLGLFNTFIVVVLLKLSSLLLLVLTSSDTLRAEYKGLL